MRGGTLSYIILDYFLCDCVSSLPKVTIYVTQSFDVHPPFTAYGKLYQAFPMLILQVTDAGIRRPEYNV